MALGSVCPYSNGCQLKVRSINPECIEVYDGKNKLGTGSMFTVTGKTKEFKIKYNCPDPKEDTKEGRDLTIVLRNTITNDPYTIEVEVVPVVFKVSEVVDAIVASMAEKGKYDPETVAKELSNGDEEVEKLIFNAEDKKVLVYVTPERYEDLKKNLEGLQQYAEKMERDVYVELLGKAEKESGCGDDCRLMYKWATERKMKEFFAPSMGTASKFIGACAVAGGLCTSLFQGLNPVGTLVNIGLESIGCGIAYGAYSLLYPQLVPKDFWTAGVTTTVIAGVTTSADFVAAKAAYERRFKKELEKINSKTVEDAGLLDKFDKEIKDLAEDMKNSKTLANLKQISSDELEKAVKEALGNLRVKDIIKAEKEGKIEDLRNTFARKIKDALSRHTQVDASDIENYLKNESSVYKSLEGKLVKESKKYVTEEAGKLVSYLSKTMKEEGLLEKAGIEIGGKVRAFGTLACSLVGGFVGSCFAYSGALTKAESLNIFVGSTGDSQIKMHGQNNVVILAYVPSGGA